MPKWVAAILDSRSANLAARVLLTFLFWRTGVEQLGGFHEASLEVSRLGLPAPSALAATLVLTQLGGAALVIWGRYAWLGAAWLAGFTLLTIPIAHHFWDMPPAERMAQIYEVREHLSLCGGLFLTAALCGRRGVEARGSGRAAS